MLIAKAATEDLSIAHTPAPVQLKIPFDSAWPRYRHFSALDLVPLDSRQVQKRDTFSPAPSQHSA